METGAVNPVYGSWNKEDDVKIDKDVTDQWAEGLRGDTPYGQGACALGVLMEIAYPTPPRTRWQRFRDQMRFLRRLNDTEEW